ncbi:hypothetical protein D918_06384 [Trichuris suis]|nr:hypothetical protein D918_06384 [Trichuris suis]
MNLCCRGRKKAGANWTKRYADFTYRFFRHATESDKHEKPPWETVMGHIGLCGDYCPFCHALEGISFDNRIEGDSVKRKLSNEQASSVDEEAAGADKEAKWACVICQSSCSNMGIHGRKPLAPLHGSVDLTKKVVYLSIATIMIILSGILSTLMHVFTDNYWIITDTQLLQGDKAYNIAEKDAPFMSIQISTEVITCFWHVLVVTGFVRGDVR